jgi:hypothetical protein
MKKMNDIQYQYAIKPLYKLNPHNPYKYKEEESDWEKICEKYGEEDKSKRPKKENK